MRDWNLNNNTRGERAITVHKAGYALE